MPHARPKFHTRTRAISYRQTQPSNATPHAPLSIAQASSLAHNPLRCALFYLLRLTLNRSSNRDNLRNPRRFIPLNFTTLCLPWFKTAVLREKNFEADLLGYEENAGVKHILPFARPSL